MWQQGCDSLGEMPHHRALRSANLEFFDLHLDNCSLNDASIWAHPDHPRVCCGADGSGLMTGIGVFVGLTSSILINLGQNIQAIGGKELVQMEKQTGQKAKECESQTWVKGLTLFITGSIGNMVAMAFASATILVPLESSQVRHTCEAGKASAASTGHTACSPALCTPAAVCAPVVRIAHACYVHFPSHSSSRTSCSPSFTISSS